jgi:hypothetical protein
VKDFSYPVKERDFSVGIVSTDKEDVAVNQDKTIGQCTEWELFIREKYHDRSDNRRKYFEYPRKIIMWVYSWSDESKSEEEEEDGEE